MFLATSKRGACELVYFTRAWSRWPCPLFIQADYVRVRVMGGGSPAMYLLIYWTFSKNKNWTFLGTPMVKPELNIAIS